MDTQNGDQVDQVEQVDQVDEQLDERKDTKQDTKFGFRSTLDGDYDITKKIGTSAVPLMLPDQMCCLVSKAGPELSTKASSVAIQIVGTFADTRERQLHIEESTFNMLTFTANTGEPFFVGSRELPPQEQTEVVDRIVTNTETAFDARMEKEKGYIERKKTGDESIYEENVQQAKIENKYVQQVEDTIKSLNQSFFMNTKKNKETKKRTVRKFSPLSSIPGQVFAVVSILRDPMKELEPDAIEDEWAVCLWGCFPTYSEAEIYKSDTLQHERVKWDHYIIKMYKPIYLDFTRTKLSSAKNVFRYDVHSQMEAQQLYDESMIKDLKNIPRDENGRMIPLSQEGGATK